MKREREAEAAAGRQAKRRLPSGAAAVGGVHQGLEMDVLASMLNTPMAKQMGAEGTDGLVHSACAGLTVARQLRGKWPLLQTVTAAMACMAVLSAFELLDG